jgi:F-box protein 18 (helicase)
MNLTEQQKDIVDAEGNIVVDAVAGSGKSTTAIEYAKARPDKKFLYTCFNRSVRDYAETKFPQNVEVKNFHSLAYRETNAYQWELAKSFDVFDVIDILKIKKVKGKKNFDAKLAGHIKNALEIYFNSGIIEVEEFDYLDFVDKVFAEENIELIHNGVKNLFDKMSRGEIPITHNFYLKQFHISKPKLNYDYIIGDEFQDCSPCILDIFGKQACNKLVLGDVYQSCYAFLLAENALQEFKNQGYQELKLTQSFRFRQDVADLAKQIIDMKKHINVSHDFEIKGVGGSDASNSRAYLSRSNLQLIVKAADVVDTTNNSIHFEGNINSYMFSDGVGLYDIFFLWSGQSDKVKNKFLSNFDSYQDYKDFISEVGNRDQEIFCRLVEKYKGGIFQVIKKIKERNVDKDKADIVLSTTHKAKGLTYDIVEVAPDFIRENQILEAESFEYPRLNEEINILYIAATRVANKMTFPHFYLNEFPKLKESKR